MDERLANGIKLFNSGQYFEAHERWEELWRETQAPSRRLFYQSLIHAAVGFHHLENANISGGLSQFRKALIKISAVKSYDGIDSEGLIKQLSAALNRKQLNKPFIQFTLKDH